MKTSPTVRRSRPRTALLLAALGAALAAVHAGSPNILWITCEDTGPELGCYGDAYARTPNLDRLAARGLRYRRAWSTAPVCAPARTTIISGVYPTSTGSQHMRSETAMPAFMQMYPQFLRQRGYYCSNNSKEDYNLTKPGKVWDDSSAQAHYRNRQAGQPFFAVFNFTGTHESQIRRRPHALQHDPAGARVPAYHPDTPEVRHDWAQYYDNITAMDAQAGRLLQELETAGLASDTIVFFYGDHGSGMPRSKRWPYNSGLHVPLIVFVPDTHRDLAPKEYQAGGWSDRLVGFIDLAPTLLSLAGAAPPEWMQGHAFMGSHQTPPPRYLHGFRGRMDERYDMVRSVTDGRFVYIRNYLPHLIYGQYLDYMFQTPTTRIWKQLYDEGKLAPPQTFFWEPKPPEELYDLESDRDEVKNLAASSAHQSKLEELRQAQRDHLLRIRDVGFLVEAEMHRRAQGTTIYEMGHDPRLYPLERILEMAEAASRLQPEAMPTLEQGLGDADPAVRYWAVLGFQMRGREAVARAASGLRQALRDSSPAVRIAAAQSLGQYGPPADLELALAVLQELAPADRNGAYVSMLALNAIDALGSKASSLRELIRTMPVKDPQAPARANGYVDRLVKNLVGATNPAPAPSSVRVAPAVQPAASERAEARLAAAKPAGARPAADRGAAAPSEPAASAAAGTPDGTPYVYKKSGGRELRLFVLEPAGPRLDRRRPGIVFFHGGGWVGGRPSQFNEQARHFARRGMVCVQVEYRLLTTRGAPPTICAHDAKSAMRWVRAHASDWGLDRDRIAAAGGSAGGHLAAFVGMVDGLDDPQDDRNVSPKANALLLFNPVLDNGPGGWGADRVGDLYRQLSPAHNVSSDDPPAIVFLGTQDRLIPVETIRRFQQSMEKAGIRCDARFYEGQPHGFFNYGRGDNRYYRETLADADAFLVSLGWLKPSASATPSAPIQP